MVGHQLQSVGEGGMGMDGDRVHHHAELELLHLRHLGGLRLGIEVAVDHADAAGLGHGDGELRLGHGVHGRGEDRNMHADRPGDARADIDGAWQHVGGRRPDEHVVKGQRDLGIVGKFAGF